MSDDYSRAAEAETSVNVQQTQQTYNINESNVDQSYIDSKQQASKQKENDDKKLNPKKIQKEKQKDGQFSKIFMQKDENTTWTKEEKMIEDLFNAPKEKKSPLVYLDIDTNPDLCFKLSNFAIICFDRRVPTEKQENKEQEQEKNEQEKNETDNKEAEKKGSENKEAEKREAEKKKSQKSETDNNQTENKESQNKEKDQQIQNDKPKIITTQFKELKKISTVEWVEEQDKDDPKKKTTYAKTILKSISQQALLKNLKQLEENPAQDKKYSELELEKEEIMRIVLSEDQTLIYLGTSFGRVVLVEAKDFLVKGVLQNILDSPVTDIRDCNDSFFVGHEDGQINEFEKKDETETYSRQEIQASTDFQERFQPKLICEKNH